MLSTFFKSMIDQDRSAVVVCGLDHTILYMNPAAVTLYEKWGGAALLGKSLLDCHNAASAAVIRQAALTCMITACGTFRKRLPTRVRFSTM